MSLAVVIAGSGCDVILRLDPVSIPATAASYRKPITITQDSLDTLVDEPVSIVLASDGELATHAAADGSDLVFTDGAARLEYEIASYDAGTLDAWVRVPALPPGTTTIYLEYGGAAASPHDPARTWSDAYVGVWHLSDTAEVARDSTYHGHDLAPTGTGPTAIAGIAGAGRAFDAASMQRVCGGDGDGSFAFDETKPFSYSLWVDVDGVSGFVLPLHKGGSSPTVPGFDVELQDGPWAGYVGDGTAHISAQLGNMPVLHRWVELGFVIDRGTGEMRAYLDGTLQGSAPLAIGSVAGTEPLCLGAEASGVYALTGNIDEPRVWLGVRTNAEIRFAHANLALRGSVIAIGAEQAVSGHQ